MHRLLLLVASAALVAGACAATPAPLAGRDYLSVHVTEGGAPKALVDGTRVRLDFGASDLGADAGCNSIAGTYRIEGGRLAFDGAGMTDMGCDPARHAQDAWLVGFLSSGPVVRVVGPDLTLDGGATVITLRDREVVEPDANITGPTWTVESVIAGDAVASVPADVEATLRFGADGSLELFAGCNRGGGRWNATGAGIQVADIVLTKMACDGPATELEASVLEVLRAPSISASIDANLLTLQANGRGLQLRAG